MRLLFICTFLSCSTFLFGQDFVYPAIKQKGFSIRDFVPVGWRILDTAFGDLNRDYLDDYAIILQHCDSVALVKKDENIEDTVLTQPRILLILFKNSVNDSLYVVEQSKSFILNHDDPAMEDPYQSTKIDKGLLQIEFHLFYNMGSWYVNNISYKFHYRNNQFVLIGADKWSFHRATHDFEEYSYNFLTKKRSLVTGNEKKGTKLIKWKPLNIKKLKTLKTFNRPFTWEVEKYVYL